MNEEQASKEFEALKERSLSEAFGSVNPFENAVAIALSSCSVEEKILAKLTGGEKLKNIEPVTAYSSSISEYPLVFVFEHLVGESIPPELHNVLVTVDIPSRSVLSEEENAKAQEFAVDAAPFSLSMPSLASSVVTTEEEMAVLHDQEMRFAEENGVNQSLLTSSQTPYTSPYETAFNTPGTQCPSATGTVSGGVRDDTKTDFRSDDYQRDYRTDYKTDNKWDHTDT